MFQTRLKELREAAGYKSQQAFADVFGVAQSTVGGWEAGKREPNYATTIKLARFFGVTVDSLLGMDEEKAPLTVISEEHLLASEYHQLSSEDQALIGSMIHSLSKKRQPAATLYVAASDGSRHMVEVEGEIKLPEEDTQILPK